MFRFRVFLVLALVGLGVILVVRPPGFDLSGDQAVDVPVSTPRETPGDAPTPAATFPINRPAMDVLSAPTELVLREPGTIEVQAVAPAVPGDTVYLRTGGTYGLGYNKVSTARLDDGLRAVLDVPGRKYLGTFTYWAAIPASATHQEGTSQKVQIKIGRPTPQVDPDCGRGPDPVKSDGTRWVCTFDDEFDGTSLDRRYWVPQVTETSGFTTGTRSTYACAYDGPDTISVAKGALNLSLVDLGEKRRCGRNKSSQYVFGQVMHFQTYAQTYGKYEIRAKIPDVGTDGVQQSFWLWPVKNSYGPWPASGEIDFAEVYSSTPGVLRPYLHYLPGEKEGGSTKNVVTARCPIKVGEYNTYGVEWVPGRITVLLNGDVCFVNDYSSAAAAVHGKNSPFDKPFYLSLNQAMGALGNEYEPGISPTRATTLVDYVRIWK